MRLHRIITHGETRYILQRDNQADGWKLYLIGEKTLVLQKFSTDISELFTHLSIDKMLGLYHNGKPLYEVQKTPIQPGLKVRFHTVIFLITDSHNYPGLHAVSLKNNRIFNNKEYAFLNFKTVEDYNSHAKKYYLTEISVVEDVLISQSKNME